MYKDAGDEHDAPHHELDHTPHDLFVEMAELIGKNIRSMPLKNMNSVL